jgi:hypothetical protein
VLVVLGVDEQGHKELLAMDEGYGFRVLSLRQASARSVVRQAHQRAQR